MSDLDELKDRYHRSVEALIHGDPEPQRELWSRRDDVTLANPYGPPVKGWDRVCEAAARAASRLRDGEGLTFDRISSYDTADLAYEVGIQRFRAKLDGGDDMSPVALRVTTVYRREDSGWKIVHRHADTIPEERSPAGEQPSGATGGEPAS
jgi:ketosteroid isomerase-like protein